MFTVKFFRTSGGVNVHELHGLGERRRNQEEWAVLMHETAWACLLFRQLRHIWRFEHIFQMLWTWVYYQNGVAVNLFHPRKKYRKNKEACFSFLKSVISNETRASIIKILWCTVHWTLGLRCQWWVRGYLIQGSLYSRVEIIFMKMSKKFCYQVFWRFPTFLKVHVTTKIIQI